MKYLFLSLLLLLITYYSFAQRKDSIDNSYNWAARINPLALVDPMDLHLNLGVERRFHPSWSVATELSWYFASGYYNSIKKTNGFMLKPSFRFYPNQGKMFFDAELFYKRVSYQFTEWLGRGVVNGVPAYEEFTDFTVRKSVRGGHVKIGRQSYLWGDEKFRLEIFAGIGLRDKLIQVKDDPRAVYSPQGLFAGRNLERDAAKARISTTMGFRISRMFY